MDPVAPPLDPLVISRCTLHSFNFCYLVSVRLKSVKNIQKITKSMKMVSAAKFGRAERELKPARSYGAGASGKRLNCDTCIMYWQ